MRDNVFEAVKALPGIPVEAVSKIAAPRDIWGMLQSGKGIGVCILPTKWNEDQVGLGGDNSNNPALIRIGIVIVVDNDGEHIDALEEAENLAEIITGVPEIQGSGIRGVNIGFIGCVVFLHLLEAAHMTKPDGVPGSSGQAVFQVTFQTTELGL